VIIAHGVGGCRGREFTTHSLELVKHLISSGFAVLVIDLRGHGASGGARMTYGIRERREVLGAVDWLLAQGYAAGAIGVLGTSMGGVAAIGAAGEEPAIGALISDSADAGGLCWPSIACPRQRRTSPVLLDIPSLGGELCAGEPCGAMVRRLPFPASTAAAPGKRHLYLS
jgi:alpha-beta hydrolase superfamily lysophospholipase